MFSKQRCVELAREISAAGGDLTATTARVAAQEGFTPEQAFKLGHFVNVVTHQGLFGQMQGGDRYVEFDVCDPTRLQTLMGTTAMATKTAQAQETRWSQEVDYVAPLPVQGTRKTASADLDWVPASERAEPLMPYSPDEARYLLRCKVARARDEAMVQVAAYQARCEELAAEVRRGAVRFDKLAHDMLALGGPECGEALVRQVGAMLPRQSALDVDPLLCYPGVKFAEASAATSALISRALAAQASAREATKEAVALRERVREAVG